MGPITVRVEIDLPRPQVFAEIADLAKRPSFTEPYQTDYRLARLESTGVGAAARFRCAAGGGWMSTQVVEVQAPYRLVEQGRGGRLNRVPTATVWELVENSAGLSELAVTFYTSPTNPFDRLTELRKRSERRHRRGWQESLNRLRQRLESESASDSAAVRVAGQDRVPVMPTGTLASI